MGPKQTHRLYTTEPYFDAGSTNQDEVSFVVPNMRAGHFIGATGIDVTLTRLGSLINGMRFDSGSGSGGNGSFAFLATARGNLITYPNPTVLAGKANAGATIHTVAHGRFAALAGAVTTTGSGSVVLDNGSSAHVFIAHVPTANWTLVFVVPDAIIFAPLQGLLRAALLLTAVSVALMLMLVALQAGRIVRPLERVTAAAGRLAVGDTDVEALLPPTSRDEVGVLTVSIRAIVAHQQEMAQLAGNVAAKWARRSAR